MPFCNDVPATVIPPRSEGGEPYPPAYDPADELSGMAPWDPNYVPPDPPAADGTRTSRAVVSAIDPPVGQTWAEQPYPQR